MFFIVFKNKAFILFNKGGTSKDNNSDDIIGGLSEVKLQELLLFDFEKLVLPQTTSTCPTNLDRVVLVLCTRCCKCNTVINHCL